MAPNCDIPLDDKHRRSESFPLQSVCWPVHARQGFFTPVFQSIANPRLPLPTTQRAFVHPKNLTGIFLAGSPQMAWAFLEANTNK